MAWMIATMLATGAGVMALLLTRVERVRIQSPLEDCMAGHGDPPARRHGDAR